jgi:hypothetical protein
MDREINPGKWIDDPIKWIMKSQQDTARHAAPPGGGGNKKIKIRVIPIYKGLTCVFTD